MTDDNTFPNLRIGGFPSSYVQGRGVLMHLEERLAHYPGPVGIVIEPGLLQMFPTATAQAVRQFMEQHVVLPFAGECTVEEINRLTRVASGETVRTVLAVGGGKSLDTGKAISRRLGTPIVIAPSIASNDAPTSRLSVIYNADHSVAGVELMPRNPDAVLVDTDVIANAPVRFLIAGIGDAIGKFFESSQVAGAGGQNFFGGQPTSVASALAASSYETLQHNSSKAVADCRNHTLSPELEQIIECNILISGLCFENGGLSITHAMIRGLSAQQACRGMLHGELAAFALLVQIRLSHGLSNELSRLIQLFEEVGLPTSLRDMGFEDIIPYSQALEIARYTLEAPYAGNFERQLSEDDIARALVEHETGKREVG